VKLTDGDVELIETGKALLEDIADAYIAKRTESIDTDEELPEIRFYYEGVEVCSDMFNYFHYCRHDCHDHCHYQQHQQLRCQCSKRSSLTLCVILC